MNQSLYQLSGQSGINYSTQLSQHSIRNLSQNFSIVFFDLKLQATEIK